MAQQFEDCLFEIEAEPDRRTLRRFLLSYVVRDWLFWLSILVLSTIPAIVVGGLAMGYTSRRAGLVVGIITYLIVAAFRLYRGFTKAADAHVYDLPPVVCRLFSCGIELLFGPRRDFVPWGYISAVSENDDGFVVRYHDNFIWISHKVFRPDDIQTFKEIISEHVAANASLKWRS